MSSMGNRKRSKSRSRSHSRSRDKREKNKNSYNSDHKDRSHHRSRKHSEDGIKLYLSNLGSSVTEKKVMDEFKYFGDVIDISLRRKNGRSNYFGYVVMKSRSAAERAMKEINKSLDWRVTLYDKDDKRDRHRSKSSSFSKSRSRSRSENNTKNDEDNKIPQESEKRPEDNKPIRVREIWVGNLPNNISEQNLYNQFFIFGEISKMDPHFQHDKNYAFIKYRLSASASRAYEKAKNMNFNGNIIRVSFSDSGKRRDIIGDESGYEVNEKTCKMLHLSLNKGSQVASEQVLKDMFKKYGTIKGFHIKNSPGFRPAIYLEYSKPEETQVALENLNTLDTNNEKKSIIGDPNCDINYYFKKKINAQQFFNNQNLNMNMNNTNMINPNIMNPFMNPQMRMMNSYMMNPMMNPQLRMMMQRQMMGQFSNQGMSNQGMTNPTMQNMNQMSSVNMGSNPQGSQGSQGHQGLQVPQGIQMTTSSTSNTEPNSAIINLQNQTPSNIGQNPVGMNMGMNMPYYQHGNPQNINSTNMSQPNVSQPSIGQPNIGLPSMGQPSMSQSSMIPPMSSMPNIPQMMQRYPFPMNMQMNRMVFPNQFNNPMMFPQIQQSNNQDSSNVKDLIQNALTMMKSQNSANNTHEEVDDQDLSSIREDTPNVFEKEYSLEDENLKNIWGGFLTKNKKDRVCVDAYQIRNECTEFLNNEYNLNVSHRTQFEDIVKRPIIGIIAFSPQNATQCEIFQDYINYFNEKNRAGLINLKNQMILYLIPPSDFSRKFYQNPKKHLLGIFVNSTVEPKSYVDMNNLSLPPPVISLTQKRLILKNLKKTNSNTSNINASVQNVINSDPSDKLSELSKIMGTMEQDKIDLLLKAAAEISQQSNTDNSSQSISQNDLAFLLSNPQIKSLLSHLNK